VWGFLYGGLIILRSTELAREGKTVGDVADLFQMRSWIICGFAANLGYLHMLEMFTLAACITAEDEEAW
jgi:hypothetical protein